MTDTSGSSEREEHPGEISGRARNGDPVTQVVESDLHPIVRRAAKGILPDWTRAGRQRREHMARVADVLEGWAVELNLGPSHILRWRSLGFLHDSLRDAEVDELRSMLESAFQAGSGSGSGTTSGSGSRVEWQLDRGAFSFDLGAGIDGSPDRTREWAPVDGSLHGPAAALRLAREGVEDPGILSAVAYHTVGHPELGAFGRALYCADFVEPGRSEDPELRARLRERFPGEPDGVFRRVLVSRIGYLLERERPIFLGTARMWNRLTRSHG